MRTRAIYVDSHSHDEERRNPVGLRHKNGRARRGVYPVVDDDHTSG